MCISTRDYGALRQRIAVGVGAQLSRRGGGERQDCNETADHEVNDQCGSSLGKSMSITCPSSVTLTRTGVLTGSYLFCSASMCLASN